MKPEIAIALLCLTVGPVLAEDRVIELIVIPPSTPNTQILTTCTARDRNWGGSDYGNVVVDRIFGGGNTLIIEGAPCYEL